MASISSGIAQNLNAHSTAKGKKRILLVNNLAGIWDHNLLLTKLAFQLDPNKTEITTVACGGDLSGTCTVMESRKRNPLTSKQVRALDCKDCKFSARLSNGVLRGKGLAKKATVLFSTYLSPEIFNELDNALAIYEGQLEEILDRSFDGIQFARVSIYETLLKFKKKDLSLDDAQELHFRDSLRNTILTYLLANKFFAHNGNFDSVYAFSPQYSLTRAVTISAEKLGMRVCFIDGSSNISERSSSVTLWDMTKLGASNPAILKWPGSQGVHLGGDAFGRIEGHIQQLLSAKSFSVYSEPYKGLTGVRKFFGIPPQDKLATLVLSSTDEVFAAKLSQLKSAAHFPGEVYENQQEWVRDTIDWFAAKRGMSLIIRMHPREMTSRRSPVKSQQAVSWENLSKDLPRNVHFNHPDQKIPLKSILMESNAVLSGWSSVGIEALLEGLPVITYDSTLSGYPAELQCTGDSRADYLRNLEKFAEGTLPEKDWPRLSKLWLGFQMNLGTVKLSGRMFHNSRNKGPRVVSRALNGLDLFLPYLSRPIEALLTVRNSSEKHRIRHFEENALQSLFD